MSDCKRIIIVDALRGFALLCIILVHCVEHFDLYQEPVKRLLFSAETDAIATKVTFFLFSGKAYSIFALLFGLSFYIQIDRNEKRGIDFSGRFIWRLFLLLCFGLVNSLFFKADILHIYALLGFLLLILNKLNTRALVVIFVLLFVQLPSVFQFIVSFFDPDFKLYRAFNVDRWLEGNQVNGFGKLHEVMLFNVWKGRSTVWGWIYDNGRHLQLVSLFIAGIILGRIRFFEQIIYKRKVILRLLILSIIMFIGLELSKNAINRGTFSSVQAELLSAILNSFTNLALTCTTIALFIILYIKFPSVWFIRILAQYGKMSLTNYVLHDIIGVFFFFGFGLGMYRYFGNTLAVLFGVILFFMQIIFTKLWMSHFQYGPLEWLWRVLTYVDFSLPMKR